MSIWEKIGRGGLHPGNCDLRCSVGRTTRTPNGGDDMKALMGLVVVVVCGYLMGGLVVKPIMGAVGKAEKVLKI